MTDLLKYIIFRWTKGIISYFIIVGRFGNFFAYVFAPGLLLRTIFWPWKKDLVASPKAGFDPKEWFHRKLGNLFARIIGFMVKTITLVFFFAIEAAWWVLAIVFFPVWLLLPFVFFILLGIFLRDLAEISDFTNIKLEHLILEALRLVGIVFLLVFETRVYKHFKLGRLLRPNPSSPNEKDPWFLSVCSHLLLIPEKLREALKEGKLDPILKANRLKQTEFEKIVSFEVQKQINDGLKKAWTDRRNLFSKRPLTEDWCFGWTFVLNQFSNDLALLSHRRSFRLFENELSVIKNTLNESKGVNLAVVGESGVGRKTLIETLAQDMASRDVPPGLLGKRILEFHLESLLAQSSLPEQKILLLEKALTEASYSDNTILFIPNLSNYLEAKIDEGEIGKLDISGVLINFLENTRTQIITLATPSEVNSLSMSHAAFFKYFKKVSLKEPQEEDVLIALCETGRSLEEKYGILITYSSVKRAFEISDRYLGQPEMPKRAVDFLKEAVTYLHNKDPEDHIIKEKEIEEFASMKVGIKIGDVETEEREKLSGLEDEMKKRIIGQREAIKAVSSALKRRRLDLSNPNRPAGCFLFLGPTGVGKTHTAEILSELYYGGEDRMIRLDMSEYQGEDSLTKLLGDSSGKIEGYFSKVLAVNPFSLILLDELEKASKIVHQLLLQIMEEGMAKTGTGRRLNFRESIIIATSNAEALYLKKLFGENKEIKEIQKKVLTKIQEDGIFSPELLNRFDEAIMFHPTTPEDNFQIAGIALKDLAKRLSGQNIIISHDDSFQKKLADLSYNSDFGAREMRRVIQKDVENAIANDLLAGKIEKGKEFRMPMEYLG